MTNDEYFDQSNKLLSGILNLAVENSPKGWDCIKLKARFGEGVIEYQAHYYMGEEKKSIFLPKDVMDMLEELGKINSSEEKGSLTGLLFDLGSDLNFKVSYDYDN